MNEDINNNIVPTTESMPQQPIQPTPAMPQQPVGPAPAMPQQPVQPTPVMPQQPDQPTPVMPQQPVQPAPTMPQQPVGPTPVMPQQPTQEANAVDPMSAVSNLNKEEAMEEALSHIESRQDNTSGEVFLPIRNIGEAFNRLRSYRTMWP